MAEEIPLRSNHEPAIEVKSSQAQRVDHLKDLLAGSSFSGLSHIASNRSRWIKSFWTLIFLSGLVGFTFNLYGLVNRFMKKPVVENYSPVGRKFIWPDITMCNPTNPLPMWLYPSLSRRWKALVNRSLPYEASIGAASGRMQKYDTIIAMSSLEPLEFRVDEGIDSNVFDAQINDFETDEDLISNFGTIRSFRKKYGAYFYARPIANQFPMSCLTFNPAGFGGIESRLNRSKEIERVKLFAVMDLRTFQIFDSFLGNRRMEVYVSAPNHMISKKKMHIVSTGVDAFIKVSMKVIERLKRQGNCIDAPFKMEVFDVTLTRTHTFYGDFDDCHKKVLQEETVKNCKCYNPSLALIRIPGINFPRLCLNLTLYTPKEMASNFLCQTRVIRSKLTKAMAEEKCTKFKKNPCLNDNYDVTHDAVPWPMEMTQSRANFLEAISQAMPTSGTRSVTKDYLRKNMAIINLVKLSGDSELLVEEYSYTTSQFISDLGGIIGLWMGLSIISAFELVEILFATSRIIFPC